MQSTKDNVLVSEKRADLYSHAQPIVEALMENIEGCIKLINLQGELEYLSPRGLCLLEIEDKTQVLGTKWSALWPKDLQNKIDDAVRLALSGQSSEFSAPCPTAKDNLKYWQVRVFPIYDNNKTLLGILSISTDKTAEKRLLTANQKLEQSEKEKVEKAKKLEKINKELGQFSHMAAHDLKTPLNNIASYASVLIDQIDKNQLTKGREFAQIIHEQITKMTKYVDDLLKFSSASQQKLHNSIVPIKVIIDNLAKQIIEASEKEVDFRCHDIPFSLVADEIKISSIFQNLIENAIKYSNQKVKVQIHYRFDVDNACHHFIVEDNGIGIHKKDFDKIFLPFRRGHSDIKGTGIGLAIVRNFVQLHGGEVWVESELDSYTKFHVTIVDFKIGDWTS